MSSQKREDILSTAKALFWKFGMKRVSIEEICRESGVSKMTFYKHFRNKNDLAICLLREIQESGLSQYRTIMAQDIAFPDKIEQTIRFKFEQTRDLSREFFEDLHRNAPDEVVAYFNRIYQENLQVILRDYTEAQKKGEIRQDVKPEFILYFLNQMMKMAEDPVLQSQYASVQDSIMELTRFFFYGILPRESQDDE